MCFCLQLSLVLTAAVAGEPLMVAQKKLEVIDEAFWSFEQRHLVVSKAHSNPLTILLISNKSKKNAKEPVCLNLTHTFIQKCWIKCRRHRCQTSGGFIYLP